MYGYTGTFTEERTQTHSPLISGTFSLTIGGMQVSSKSGSTDLSYAISFSDLQSAIRSSAAANNVVGFDRVEVSAASVDGCEYGCEWIIQYKEYKGSIPSVTVNGASLVGGASTPGIFYTTIKTHSTAIIHSPIDFRFLNTQSNMINVLVEVNGVPAICTGNCGYTFNDYS